MKDIFKLSKKMEYCKLSIQVLQQADVGVVVKVPKHLTHYRVIFPLYRNQSI